MKEYDATEQAYWNGYRKAVETFEKSQKTEANPIEKSNGMTESEIMKALECCPICNHEECPFEPSAEQYKGTIGCCDELMASAFDLINRKNAENEDLQNQLSIFKKLLDKAEEKIEEKDSEIEEYKERFEMLDSNSQMAIGYADALEERAKAEAIKEFAEMIMKGIVQENDIYTNCAKNMRSVDYQRGYEEKNDSIVSRIIHTAKEMGVEL